jgi:SAM-dependent methyltransferase
MGNKFTSTADLLGKMKKQPRFTEEEMLRNVNLDHAQAAKAAYDLLCNKTTSEEIRKSPSGLDPSNMETFISLIPSGGKIVDIGCGFGREVNYFSNLGFDAVGVDISERVTSLAKSLYPNEKFVVGDFRDCLRNSPELYNGIFENLSMFYLPKKDIETAYLLIFEKLKPEGVFQISMEIETVPRGTGWHLLPVSGEPTGVKGVSLSNFVYNSYYFTDELESTLKEVGFNIVKCFKRRQEWVDRDICTVICQKKG